MQSRTFPFPSQPRCHRTGSTPRGMLRAGAELTQGPGNVTALVRSEGNRGLQLCRNSLVLHIRARGKDHPKSTGQAQLCSPCLLQPH